MEPDLVPRELLEEVARQRDLLQSWLLGCVGAVVAIALAWAAHMKSTVANFNEARGTAERRAADLEAKVALLEQRTLLSSSGQIPAPPGAPGGSP